MAYEVTATRRRPQRFDDLVGQEFVAETLKNSIKSGKIAHAYLFSGPRGCGKTSTARILAKALNCQNGPTDNPCGTCSNCQEITKGSSLDVIEIDGASNTSVENIRQIKDEVLFPPSKCRYKIYIIDEVHMLSTSAFNALLKTIEEPPPYVIFIFATTELQKVPATIKSRCQQFNFRLVAIEKVKQCLAEAAAELNIQADDEALFWIARESTGSMRDAYTLFDQVVAFSDGHMTYDKIRDKLGLVGIDRLNTIFDACAANKTDEVINLLDEFLQVGVSIEQLISNCADYLRSLLLIKNGITKEALLGNSVERYSRNVLNAWNAVQIERALSIFLQLYRDIRYSLSPRYELELAFSRLCWIGQYVSNVEVKKAIDAAQALLMGAGGAVNASAAVNQTTTAVNASPAVNQTAAAVNPTQAFANQSAAAVNAPSAGAVPVGNAGSAFGNETPQGLAGGAAAVNAQPSGLQEPEKPKIPFGLPQLKIDMNQVENEPAPDENAGDSGEEPNPFLNGGPLPPEKSVEQLKIIQTAAPSVVIEPIPQQDYSYAVSSDEFTDDWSNTDVPPEDDYYVESDEEVAQRLVEQYDEAEENGQQNETAKAQLEDMFQTADGRTISIAQLRGGVVAALNAISDTFAVNSVEKTGRWTVTENGVNTTVQSQYDLSLINNKNKEISAEISNICGKNMTFNVSLKEPEKKNEGVQQEIPPQVQMLVNLFKGSIV